MTIERNGRSSGSDLAYLREPCTNPGEEYDWGLLWTKHSKGGLLSALEQPDSLVDDERAFFREPR